MAYEVFLFDTESILSQPPWWRNFLKKPNVFDHDQTNRALREWNATFHTELSTHPYGKRWLVFESKEEFTAFVLRWS